MSNLLDANTAGIETSSAKWAADTNCTIAQSAAQAHSGTKSLALTSTASAGNLMSAITTDYFAVTALASYSPYCWIRAATSPQIAALAVLWYSPDVGAGPVFLSIDGLAAITDSTSAWTQAPDVISAPSGATLCQLAARAVVAGVGDVHYFDDFFLDLTTPAVPVAAIVHHRQLQGVG